jgi:RimJ/RimL family protein N-acetyltransferase
VRLLAPDATYLCRVAGWLADDANARWLDFGPGGRGLTLPALTLMAKRPHHVLRIFTADDSDEAAGLVAFSDLAPHAGTATLWYVLGAKEHAGRGLTTRAVSRLLGLGFADLGLVAVSAWAVAGNVGSMRVLERNGFRFVGRQRRCHVMDGCRYDRLLYDLLVEEHGEHRA